MDRASVDFGRIKKNNADQIDRKPLNLNENYFEKNNNGSALRES